MCLALFIAADTEPRLVPWDVEGPAFNVVEATAKELRVARHFSKPKLRYVGAHTCCSCGFNFSPFDQTKGPERQKWQASVAALRAYLGRMLATEHRDLELYACWEGDWDEPTDSRRVVTLDHFGGDTFELRERELLVVSGEG